MFEGLVQKVILGFCGRYIKDFQKDQLKITLWNTEVYLENVELILEAFDYLQLPFGLENGRVGKLSIRIPWKKLGWDPIIIVLEDVFISAVQREDREWGEDEVGKRDYAAKRAKLAAAELAKLSRRVCDIGSTGQSFKSYIIAKILDMIQVSIKNVHIIYRDLLTASEMTVFGLRFSSLTVSRQSLSGFSGGKVRWGQVNKLFEVRGLELYCRSLGAILDFTSIEDISYLNHECVHLLFPLDVLLSLMVNISGKLEDDAPQYHVNIELDNLVASLDEVQMQKILMLYDYLSTCQLREKYGRYRPWQYPLYKKLDGWKIAWWHYAQESVLADVRKRLKRTSWKYLGERLGVRRKYVNLYKAKLRCLQKDQVIEEDVLQALEEIEKLSDIDSILSYRSVAEREVKDVTSRCNRGVSAAILDVPFEDERASSKPRGWLNWLSRGMLGAGGTDDSSQFSGAISDEVIKDIYEVTEFHPAPISTGGEASPANEVFLSSIKIAIQQISLTVLSKRLQCAVVRVMLDAISSELKIWEGSTRMTATVTGAQLLNPMNNQVIMCTRKMDYVENEPEVHSYLTIEVEVPPQNCEFSSSMKVFLQPTVFTCDSTFVRNILEYFQIFGSFKFLRERVLLSVNEIGDLRTRLLSKIDYILSNQKRIMWDVSLANFVLEVPWVNDNLEENKVAIDVGNLRFKSDTSSFASDLQDGLHHYMSFCSSSSASDGSVMGVQLDDLYMHYVINLVDFEVLLSRSDSTETIPLFEKFSCSIQSDFCIISDESVLKAFDAHVSISPTHFHLSPSIFGSLINLITYFDKLHSESGLIGLNSADSKTIGASEGFWWSLKANVDSILLKVDLENDVENGYSVMIFLEAVDFGFDGKEYFECWLSTEVLHIVSCPKKNEELRYILCSSDVKPTAESLSQEKDSIDRVSDSHRCLQLRFVSCSGLESLSNKCDLCLIDIDIHYYPFIVLLLVRFIDDILECASSYFDKSSGAIDGNILNSRPHFSFQKYGFSNFDDTGLSEEASIPLDYFPFITVPNSGPITAFEHSSMEGISEWRKTCKLRARKVQPKCYYGLLKKSEHSRDYLLRNSVGNETFDIEASFGSMKLHLHDSACVIGSVSIATGKSSGSFSDGCLDILCSTEGLVISSSWWTQTANGFLWGPLLPNLSQILNIRARKEPSSSLELSFSAQHVSCTLHPEFLAVVIGYFSSTDWSRSSEERPLTSAYSKGMNLQVNSSLVYKFEILDSNLFIPVVGCDDQLLKIDVQHLLVCFVENSSFDLVFKGIPPECPVIADKFSKQNHCLNLFGRDLSLSLVVMKDGLFDFSRFGQFPGYQSFSLVSLFSADAWIRFPITETPSSLAYPIYVMATIYNCQLDALGQWTMAGYGALLDVVNEFSLVDIECTLFKSDLLEFLQSKKRMRENSLLLPGESGVTATEISLSASSVSIRLYLQKEESTVSELIAEADMGFSCSASLKNDNVLELNVSLSHVMVFSSLNSVVLLECSSFDSRSSSPKMSITVLDREGNKLLVTLPCVNLWMHVFDWREINLLVDSYRSIPSNTSTMDASAESTRTPENVADSQCSISSSYVLSESSSYRAGYSAMKLEGVFVKIYVPVLVNKDVYNILEEPQVQTHGSHNVSCNISDGNRRNFVALTLESKCSEVFSDGNKMVAEIRLEKVEGIVNLCKNNTERTWSLFELIQINMEAEFFDILAVGMKAKLDVSAEGLDVWLSNDLFYLFCYMSFEVPESGSSHPMSNSIDFNMQLRKLTIVLKDKKWSPGGLLVEILMASLHFRGIITDCGAEGSVAGDLLVNYNNIDKVLWEPFLEPWKFQLSFHRKYDKKALLSNAIMTNICLKSVEQLNLNITESLIEVVSRITEMINDVWALPEVTAHSSSAKFFDSQISENLDYRRYAPYILQNMTSLPLVFRVCCEEPGDNDQILLASNGGNFLEAGSSIPIYIDEDHKKQQFLDRSTQSSHICNDNQMVGTSHRFIIIQLEGASAPCFPISMDLVGVRYFEVDLSKPSMKSEIGDDLLGSKRYKGDNRTDKKSGFVLPVVIDVSVQHYTKLLRLYSTVVISNATSMPLEVRFDIPFGLAPKILDPIFPGKEFPLPLHLAEAGRMRWRPLGDTYLWSEAYNIANIVSQESRVNLPRTFVCYPSHPSSELFRCCVSVDDKCLPTASRIRKHSPDDDGVKDSTKSSKELITDLEMSKQRLMHLVTLSTPLLLRNYLPQAVSVVIENGGTACSALLSKVENPFFHIDSSHDLTLTFSIHHFKPSVLKFPRAETFTSMAKFNGSKFSLSETLTFDSELSDGPLFITMEKVMDALSGAREISLSVPFLIYSCIGFPLILTNSVNEIKGHNCTVASCYHMDDQHDRNLGTKEGLGLLFSNQNFQKAPVRNQIPAKFSELDAEMADLDIRRSSPYILNSEFYPRRGQPLLKPVTEPSDFSVTDHKMGNPCMFSPCPTSTSGEVMVRLCRWPSDTDCKSIPSSLWSAPFLLVPPTGSTSVIIPKSNTKAGYLISVSAVAAPYSGRTKIITFQPRYVISNACSRAMFYKQRGTDEVFFLEAGQHCHIQCTDINKEMLVSIRFEDPGWQWSGCFSPEHLGDTQLKMWNYVSGSVYMMRVEVQSADVSIEDETVVGNVSGNSGTNLILISEDDTGFMPYRIDNFSKERLRVYQQRCEMFETMVHPYTSHPYAWDEPCFPHKLTVEVLGERVMGLYTLDDVRDHLPVHLPATPEKSQRTLHVSIHSEGAIKVLSIIDSSYHVLNDLSNAETPQSKSKGKSSLKQEFVADYSERISVEIPFIGISFVNSYNEELLFACAKNSRFDLIQSVEQQKFFFNISFLQIDNQLSSTPYPVILSFDHCNKGNKEKITDAMNIDSEGMHEPVISLSVAKWRTKNMSLASYEYINLRVTDFHLELEQELILNLFKFFKTIVLRFQKNVLHQVDFIHYPSVSDTESVKGVPFPSIYDQFSTSVLPPIVPIGAPWQQIHLLARKQNKTYVESLDLAPIKMTFSFSSSPWMLRNGVLTLGESLIHRGFMALADVEGAQIHLKELVLSHQLASWESIQEILIRHYTRQSLHEMYKIFGSAGLIGNPMGFVRSMSLGIKDFLSVPVQSILRSPSGVFTGMAQGTTSLVSNTIYAISDAATQFSRAAHKGIVAFTLDDQTAGQLENQQKGMSSNSKGVINEFLEGLTGLLQSPVQGAEKHGLPGVLSGIALGVTGLVAKPAASILEVTGKTAQSIRNRSKISYMGSRRLRVRLPRSLSSEAPLRPYSWEEAIGTAVLRDSDKSGNLKLISCKALSAGGKFVIITQRMVLVVSCPSLIHLGKPEFQGIPANPEWIIDAEIGLDSVIHANVEKNVVHIIGNSMDAFLRPPPPASSSSRPQQKQISSPSPLPIFVTDLEFMCKEEAEYLLEVLLCTMKKGKDRGWCTMRILHQSNLNVVGKR